MLNDDDIRNRYNQQCEDNIPLNNKNWAFHVKRTIYELGLTDLWFEHNLNVTFHQLFQQRVYQININYDIVIY